MAVSSAGAGGAGAHRVCLLQRFLRLQSCSPPPQPYVMWDKLAAEHRSIPLSLLLMAVIRSADSSDSVPTLKAWNELDRVEGQTQGRPGPWWSSSIASIANSTAGVELPRGGRHAGPVPSVMMWDDHDIFDGWGSYPADLQGCEVYQVIYAAAAKLFPAVPAALRCQCPLLDPANLAHHPGDCVSGLLDPGPDNRATRTQSQVMSRGAGDQINGVLADCGEGTCWS